MAMGMRGSWLFSQRASTFRRSSEDRLPGKLSSPLVKLEKLEVGFGDVSHRLELHRLVPLLPHYYWSAMKQFAVHQGKLHLRLPKKELIMVNALMFTAPFQALAETCEAENSLLNMPLLLFIALVGAIVGGQLKSIYGFFNINPYNRKSVGLLARQRKGELKKLNEQLRQINAALRRQAKIESYAPNLSYAPVGSRFAESEVVVDPRKEDLISRLRAGKNFLRNQDPEKANGEFKMALELAQTLQDPIEEKKAARGLGASLQRQGKYREAIKYHSMVLKISERVGEGSGNTEAYGAIADCYTELGDLESAAKFYDKYIARLESED